MSEREEAPMRQASRAEPKPRARTAAVVGGLFALVVVVVLGVSALSPRSARVPSSLGGFRLGASRSECERRATLAGRDASAEHVSRDIEARTSVFDIPATCRLRFEADALGEIDCRLDAALDPEGGALRIRGLLATLRKLHGEESEATRVEGVERWEWRNAKAFLRLEGSDTGREARIVSGRSARP